MRHRDRALEEGRDPNVRGPSEYANEGELTQSEAALLPTAEGHEDGAMIDRPNELEAEIRSIDVDAAPMSETTADGDVDGDRETIDGLNEADEAVRQAAEDIPVMPVDKLVKLRS